MKQLEVSRNQVVNTALFNQVVVNIKKWVNDSVDVLVSVKERWYILPLPTATFDPFESLFDPGSQSIPTNALDLRPLAKARWPFSKNFLSQS